MLCRRQQQQQKQQEQDHCNGLPPELPPTRLETSFALKINSCNNNSNNNESIPKKEEHYPRVVPPRVLGNRPNSPLLITMVAPAAMAVVCATEKN
jgi:hypothetical protein